MPAPVPILPAMPAPNATENPRPAEELLAEEWLCAILLALMVLLMFAQALARNVPPVARMPVGAWLSHATEVLPAGLTWLTFLGCGAVTRRAELLRIGLFPNRLGPCGRRRLEIVTWAAWGTFFAVLFVLGVAATIAQRKQMTSLEWLPQWAVASSIPLGSALVVWRTCQNIWATCTGECVSLSSARPPPPDPPPGKGEATT